MPALGVNHPESVLPKEAFLKRMQMECALELNFEGHRWSDIKRWGLVDSQEGLVELGSRDVSFNNFEIGKHCVMPIPSSEIDNNPGMTHNPKY